MAIIDDLTVFAGGASIGDTGSATAGGRLADEAFIDVAITVVIDAITHVGIGWLTRLTRIFYLTVHTDGVSVRRARALTTRGHGCPESVVDFAITVVVDAIA